MATEVKFLNDVGLGKLVTKMKSFFAQKTDLDNLTTEVNTLKDKVNSSNNITFSIVQHNGVDCLAATYDDGQ